MTLRDLYRCAIDSGLLNSRLVQAQADVREEPAMRVTVRAEDFAPRAADLHSFGPWEREGEGVSAAMTRGLLDALEEAGIEARRERPSRPPVAPDAEGRLAAFELWLEKDWQKLDGKLRTSVVEGVSSFLGIFDQPEVARVFCPGPPAVGEVPEEGATFSGVVPALLQPLPRLRELIENGTVLCLNMPAGTSPALARGGRRHAQGGLAAGGPAAARRHGRPPGSLLAAGCLRLRRVPVIRGCRRGRAARRREGVPPDAPIAGGADRGHAVDLFPEERDARRCLEDVVAVVSDTRLPDLGPTLTPPRPHPRCAAPWNA